MHEERYVKKLTIKEWEGRMVGYRNDSTTNRIFESGTKIVVSRNVAFFETFPVKLNAFDHDNSDDNDDAFLDLEPSSIPLGMQEEIPETEADAEPGTGDSKSGGIISNVDEESDRDVDSRPSEAAKATRNARQLRHLGDSNKGQASTNTTAIYQSILDYAYIIGQPLLNTPNACKVSSARRNNREAMASAQALEWQAYIERELASMSKHDVH